MNPGHYKTDVLIIGAGIAGIVTAIELLEKGKNVLIVDRDIEARLGGLAKDSFGGMALCGTGLQKFSGIKDSPELLYRDWLSFAEFSDTDKWPRKWAEIYAERNNKDVYRWLTKMKVRFLPAVNWVERGEYIPGNSVPRYHIVWGTGYELIEILVKQLKQHRNYKNLTLLYEKRVETLLLEGGVIKGAEGVSEDTGETFKVESEVTVIATGGINGSLEKVRDNWPQGWNEPSFKILNGSHPFSDGMLHDAVEKIGGQVTHLDWQWNYAAGIHHPKPRMPLHGLSLIPPKSALWMDATGRRVGPHPLVTGFDTHDMCRRISYLPHGFTWQIMNRKIARKEVSISGSEHNPSAMNKNFIKFMKELILGNDRVYDFLVNESEDVVTANSIEELGEKMHVLTPEVSIDIAGMKQDISNYDENIDRGPALHNDDQLRRIEHARKWRGDKIRTLKHQKILDPDAMPLLAMREFIISRKSMGGILADDHGRALTPAGDRIPGLYAVGEAAGFGGGGVNGKRALEGTFLSLCILNARIAGRSISGHPNP